MKKITFIAGITALTLISQIASAAIIDIPVKSLTTNKLIGNVVAEDTQYGLLLTPHLKDLSPGMHGFHIHENPSCQNKGMAAGGHLDPQHTEHHLGPYNPQGHLGDLPALTVNSDGTATLPVLAPRLSTQDLIGHALMIHAGGDNYADKPEKLGGGGARVACGVIK